MAYLKDLIVSGSSRFLNKAYINDAEVSTLKVVGTASFNGNLETEGTLNVGKSTAANAIIYLNNKLAMKGSDSWLRINDTKAFTSGVYFGSNIVRTDGSYQIGSSGASINMSSASAIFNVPVTSSTSITNNGSLTNNGNIYNTKGTIETDVIKANVWDIVSTQNMGGNFYVCPTIMVKDGSTFYISSVSGTSITGYIIDSTNITSADFAGHTWSQDSKIKITGKLTSGTNTYVLGVCDGTLTAAMNPKANRIDFTITCNALTVPPAGTYTISDGTVMMYSVGASNAVGIHMTSYGTNKYTYIDIYNGANGATPMARIGKLDGLAAINGVNPAGYGIYTTNGYFQGLIVANAGKIGGWTIGDSYITTNTNRTTYNATTAGLTITASGIGAGNGSLNTFYVNSSGNFMAQAGTIGGFTITTKSLYSGTYGAASSAFITTNFEGNAVAIGGSSAINTWRIGAGSKFGVNSNGTVYASDIQASGGKIGGSTITSSSIYGSNRSAYNSGTGYYLGSDGKFGVGTSTNYITFDGTSLNICGDLHLTGGISIGDAINNKVSEVESKIDAAGLSGSNILQDVYATSLTKVNAKYPRYFSDAGNTTTTCGFIEATNEILPDPNATHFVRITNTEVGKQRGLCFYNSGNYTNGIGMIIGETYKASCWVRQLTGEANFMICLGGHTAYNYADRAFVPSSEWTRYEKVFTFDDWQRSSNTTWSRLYFYNMAGENINGAGTGIGQIDMCGFRLEKVNLSSGGRNLCLRSKSYEGWGVSNNTSFAEDEPTDKIVYPAVTSATWRTSYSNNNVPYSLVRDKPITITYKVKGTAGDMIGSFVSLGLVAEAEGHDRLRYTNRYAYITANGEWQTIAFSCYITDNFFLTGSGTPDYNTAYFAIQPGAISNATYALAGFEMKEIMVTIGTDPCIWSEAPEDVEKNANDMADKMIDDATKSLSDDIKPKFGAINEWETKFASDYAEYVDKTAGRIDAVESNLKEYITTQNSYLSYGEENGVGTLTLGAKDDSSNNTPSKLKLTNTEMAFVVGENVPTYISGNVMHINNVDAEISFKVGKFAFVPFGDTLAFGLAEDLISEE